MKKFFAPNITKRGRIARAVIGVSFAVGAGLVYHFVPGEVAPWAALVIAFAAVFVFFEAFRGWCVLRACGVKTKL